MLHHAHGVDEVLCQLLRVVDAPQVQVYDVIVLVGEHRLACSVEAQRRLVALRLEFADHLAVAEGDNLDRQRELADGVDDLGLVDNPHDLVGVDRHDLLPQESRAAALDAVEVLVDFVGAINGDVDVIDIVDVHDLDTVAFSLLLRAAGGGDAGELEAFLLHAAAELVHEETHGRTGAETGDHAVLDELRGLDAGSLLQCVLLCLVHNAPLSSLYDRRRDVPIRVGPDGRHDVASPRIMRRSLLL